MPIVAATTTSIRGDAIRRNSDQLLVQFVGEVPPQFNTDPRPLPIEILESEWRTVLGAYYDLPTSGAVGRLPRCRCHKPNVCHGK